MSRYGGWKAQRSSSGARATSLEAAVAPIHHRRESACSLDVGLVPAALQRVVGLRPRLLRSLGSDEVEGSRGSTRAADGRSRRHRYRGAELGRIDAFSQFTATYAWTPPYTVAGGRRPTRASAAHQLCERRPLGLALGRRGRRGFIIRSHKHSFSFLRYRCSTPGKLYKT